MNNQIPKVNSKQQVECTNSKFSVKKILAGIGTIVIFGISGFVIYKEPGQVGNVLWPLMTLVVGLFGIKTAGGVMLKNGSIK